MENKKPTDKSSALQQFKINSVSALNDMEMIDKASKLSVMTAISCYPAIPQKVAYTVTALLPTQVTVERLFSQLRIIRSDSGTLIKEGLFEAIVFLCASGLCSK